MERQLGKQVAEHILVWMRKIFFKDKSVQPTGQTAPAFFHFARTLVTRLTKRATLCLL